MDQLIIELPTELREFVEAETKSAGLKAPEDFVRVLIEEAQQRKWVEFLEHKAEEAMASGPAVPWVPGALLEEWQRRREKLADKKG
jgi:hypothetical protein